MHAIKKIFPQNVKNLYHLFQAVVANFRYGFPSRGMRIIGVTGTDGKTTTSQIIAKIFEQAGYKVALASTINFKIDNEEWVNASKYTTQDSFATQRFLKKAKDAGCNLVVLEVASHALDQYRVWGISFEVGVITNVTREHLDYHKTMKQYREAKRILFAQSNTAIVNGDMENPQEFLQGNFAQKIVYSTERSDAEVFATDIQISLEGSQFRALDKVFRIHLPGLFNIENALAAISVGYAFHIDTQIMVQAMESIEGVPGRMQTIKNDKGFHILVDYAVTPHALEKLYELVEQMRIQSESKIIAVFGSCGDRDRGKRPIMGEIVSQKADIIILTNEDPYYEDPQRIITEIAQGVKNKIFGENYFHIMDRKKAIQKALDIAVSGDVIVITGKGAEETMAVQEKRLPWNDKRVIEELLSI